jgi:hypothetical protein
MYVVLLRQQKFHLSTCPNLPGHRCIICSWMRFEGNDDLPHWQEVREVGDCQPASHGRLIGLHNPPKHGSASEHHPMHDATRIEGERTGNHQRAGEQQDHGEPVLNHTVTMRRQQC